VIELYFELQMRKKQNLFTFTSTIILKISTKKREYQ